MAGHTTDGTEQVKSPNWQEVDQLAMYKGSREVEPRTICNKYSLRSKRDLSSASTCRFRVRYQTSSTRPPDAVAWLTYIDRSMYKTLWRCCLLWHWTHDHPLVWSCTQLVSSWLLVLLRGAPTSMFFRPRSGHELKDMESPVVLFTGGETDRKGNTLLEDLVVLRLISRLKCVCRNA